MTRQELLRALQTARANVEQGRLDNLQKSFGVNEQREVDLIVTEAKALAKSLREAHMLGPSGGVCSACGGSGRV